MDSTAKTFIERRRRRVMAWKWAGPCALAGMIALTLWLVVRHPLLVNPLAVTQGLADGSIAQSTALLMAGLLPMVTSTCLFLVFVILLFVHSAMNNEERLLAIVEGLAGQAETDASG